MRTEVERLRDIVEAIERIEKYAFPEERLAANRACQRRGRLDSTGVCSR